jgi:hypothetical protein
MEEKILDDIGVACWGLMLICPFIIIPLIWKFLDGSRMIRIAVGLLLSAVSVYLLYAISLAIIFRHGMGPV